MLRLRISEFVTAADRAGKQKASRPNISSFEKLVGETVHEPRFPREAPLQELQPHEVVPFPDQKTCLMILIFEELIVQTTRPTHGQGRAHNYGFGYSKISNSKLFLFLKYIFIGHST